MKCSKENVTSVVKNILRNVVEFLLWKILTDLKILLCMWPQINIHWGARGSIRAYNIVQLA